MELIKKNIHMDHCQELAYTQISLEEDQNISDQKPDALRVICKKAEGGYYRRNYCNYRKHYTYLGKRHSLARAN